MPGEYKFSGLLTKEDNAQTEAVALVFKVEEGGVISAQAAGDIKYTLGGIVQDGKLLLKQIFEENKELNFEGEFQSNDLVRGTYTSTEQKYGAKGTFELSKQ